MVASVCCSRVVSLATVALALCTIATSQQSKCSKIDNAIEYESDRCIFSKQWFPSTLLEAETACRNLSDDLIWTLPKFDSETSRDKMEALSAAIWNNSIKKAVFWMGLVRKNMTWKWLHDDSEMDENTAMWKKGSEEAQIGECVLGEWEEGISAAKWILSPCHSGSVASFSKHAHLLVCESKMESTKNIPSNRKRRKRSVSSKDSTANRSTAARAHAPHSKRHLVTVDPRKNARSHAKQADHRPQTWHWIVIGVCLVMIAAFIVFAIVVYLLELKWEEMAKKSVKDQKVVKKQTVVSGPVNSEVLKSQKQTVSSGPTGPAGVQTASKRGVK